jgi:hypothetical protein
MGLRPDTSASVRPDMRAGTAIAADPLTTVFAPPPIDARAEVTEGVALAIALANDAPEMLV